MIYSYVKDSAVTALTGSKGWHSGESARLLPVWPALKSRHRRHMWAEFVVGSLLCSERNQVDQEPLCGCSTSKSLFVIHVKEMHGS